MAALEAQPETPYYVFDDRVAVEKQRLVRHLPGESKRAGSLSELAVVIGCPVDELQRTIESWNAAVLDPDLRSRDPFGREVYPTTGGGIVQPPFHTAPMIVGASFTGGGFAVTPEMRIRHVDGGVIDGLFAVGDCVGGVNSVSGLGGIHLGSACTLGMLAGCAAAAASARW